MRICPICKDEISDLVCPADGGKTVDLDSFQNVQRQDPMIGLTIGEKYFIEELIGFGGFGSVYRGKHVQTSGALAIKVLSRSRIEDDSAVRRFYLEAENTHRLQHHNTVRLFDFGETDTGMLYLVMEFVEGETLAEVMLRERRFSPARAVRVCEQILKSLAEAHEKKVVHRDIKPENIMLVHRLGDEDFVKVLDFGVSRTVGGKENITVAGTVGTPAYIAPEQWRGDDEINGRADLYSVGCLIYRLLAGCSPFRLGGGDGADIALRYLKAHLETPPTPIEENVDGCPPALASLILGLLAKDPEDRPQSAVEVLEKMAVLREMETLSTEVLPYKSEQEEDVYQEANSEEITVFYGKPDASPSPEIDAVHENFLVASLSYFKRLPARTWRISAAVFAIALLVFLVWDWAGPGRIFNKTYAPLNFPSTRDIKAETPALPVERTVENGSDSENARSKRVASVSQPNAETEIVSIRLRSVPSGASVFLEGRTETLGKSPIDLVLDSEMREKLETTGELVFQFRKSDRRSKKLMIKSGDLKRNAEPFKVVLKKKPSWSY